MHSQKVSYPYLELFYSQVSGRHFNPIDDEPGLYTQLLVFIKTFICLFVCLSVCLSACLVGCLFVCLFKLLLSWY